MYPFDTDDVQKAGVAEVPEINVLIEHMSSYIINSRSDNTEKSYYYSFNRWSTFAKKHKVLKASQLKQDLFSVSMDEQASWLILAKTLYKNC
jgi:hypothetical protein